MNNFEVSDSITTTKLPVFDTIDMPYIPYGGPMQGHEGTPPENFIATIAVFCLFLIAVGFVCGCWEAIKSMRAKNK